MQQHVVVAAALPLAGVVAVVVLVVYSLLLHFDGVDVVAGAGDVGVADVVGVVVGDVVVINDGGVAVAAAAAAATVE